MKVTTMSHTPGQAPAATTMVGMVVINKSSIILGFVSAMYPATTVVGARPDSWPPRRAKREGTMGRTLRGTLTSYVEQAITTNPQQNVLVSFTTSATVAQSQIAEPDLTEKVDEVVDLDTPWIVLVWNDPINLMSYVSFIFQKLFGYSKEKADLLMLDVHEKGRAVVSTGSREHAEMDVFRLHEHGLWATMQQD